MKKQHWFSNYIQSKMIPTLNTYDQITLHAICIDKQGKQIVYDFYNLQPATQDKWNIFVLLIMSLDPEKRWNIFLLFDGECNVIRANYLGGCHLLFCNNFSFIRKTNFGGKITTNHFSQELLFRNGFITCSVTIYAFLKNCNVNVTFCMGFQSRDLFAKT